MASPEVNIFDAIVQKVAAHTLEVDANGEIVATSTASNHTIKFPGGLSRAEFDQAVADYEEANKGQVLITPEELERRKSVAESNEKLLEELSKKKK